jgi:beta-glucanase (GH16 family)
MKGMKIEMKIVSKTILIFLTIVSITLASCSKDEATTEPKDTIPQIPGYTLVWNDEFDGSNIDLTKWDHEVNGNGGGNNELQYYTNFPTNSFIENGSLVIQARKENYLGKEYTSARMRTLNKGDWTYGRFDIRAKLPFGQGLWPAIWMLPSDWFYGGWPESGEIDIMELLGHQPYKVYGTIHYGTSANHQSNGGSYQLSASTFANDYHLFTMEWDSVGMKWYVDGNLYYTTTHGQPFDKRFHMLLNVAVGGNWPGNPNLSTTFPQKMFVDYVRVYKKD